MNKPIFKTLKQKIVVIYHGSCPDGFGSAWAAWTKFGDKAAYIPAKDRLALPCPIKNKEVYVIDYTYQPELMQQLINDNIRVTAIDHHISQEVGTKMTQQYLYDLHHSGAILAWHYFHPGKKVPLVLRYIEDRDLWNWKLPHSREMLMLLDLLPFEFKAWDRFIKENEKVTERKENIKKGELLFTHYRSLYKKLLPNAELVKFDGKRIFALNCPYYFADDLGHELAKKTHSFALLWNESNGRIRVSLRSEGKVDVQKIAKKYGGGGHKAASGFSFDVKEGRPWQLL